MQIFKSATDLAENHKFLKEQKLSLGFVPTMGALHQGHLSLMEQSNSENDRTIVSIFVNPTQFNNSDDFKHYPKTLDQDLELMEKVGVDYVFLPSVKEIYPDKTEADYFNLKGLDREMEGKHRMGHFDGVATVVSRFFDLIQPDKAYFGEKDFQQFRVIQRLAKIKNYPIEIIPGAIFREPDGLAMSSRNLRLNNNQRKEAPQIFNLLNRIKSQRFRTITKLQDFAENYLKPYQNLKLEYIEVAAEEDLMPVHDINYNKKNRLFIAVFAGEIRLIDNIPLY